MIIKSNPVEPIISITSTDGIIDHVPITGLPETNFSLSNFLLTFKKV